MRDHSTGTFWFISRFPEELSYGKQAAKKFKENFAGTVRIYVRLTEIHLKY